jgi:hypothetical protein
VLDGIVGMMASTTCRLLIYERDSTRMSQTSQRLLLHTAKAQPAQPAVDSSQGQATTCPFRSLTGMLITAALNLAMTGSAQRTGMQCSACQTVVWDSCDACYVAARRDAYLGIRSNVTGAKASVSAGERPTARQRRPSYSMIEWAAILRLQVMAEVSSRTYLYGQWACMHSLAA